MIGPFETTDLNAPGGIADHIGRYSGMYHDMARTQADPPWGGPRKLAESNAQQVKMVRQVLEGLPIVIATPAEARDILKLEGGDSVGF